MVCCLIVLGACSNTRYLPKGEKLYVGAKVRIEGTHLNKKEKKNLRRELNDLTRPEPNSSFLGLRPKLLAYNISGTPKKPKGLRNWLKNKIGEAPVLASVVDLQLNRNILQNYLENKGYYKSLVNGDTTSRGRKVKASYQAFPGVQYHIRSVNFIADSSQLGKAVAATAAKSLLKTGNAYNLSVIKGERDRIDQTLKEEGFYYFNPDYLLVLVDSTAGEHTVNLFVKVKQETPLLAKNSFVIGDIYIYPNFSLTKIVNDSSMNDAVLIDGFHLIDKEKTFKSGVFTRSIIFKRGDVYNRKAHNLTLNRLISIGSFKLVTNRFERDEKAPEPTLNAFYYLTPLPRKSIRAEVLGTTKSNNLTGSEISLSWRNRNAFRGAEHLMIRGYGSFEVQISGTKPGYNTFRIGTEATLSIPQFVVPFVQINTSKANVPRTKFLLGYEILNKQALYTLNSFRTTAGYLWKESLTKEHELNVVSINFVQPANVTATYQDSIANNPILAKTIEKQFIMGPTYSFTYNNQLDITRRNNIYFNANLDLAGNILGLVQGANYKTNDTATILGARYSQYAKIDGDFRYYLKTGRNSKIVSRIIAGVGYPFGNSSELPFIKQFFAGGTNSIRAFRARSVGPGTYRQDESNSDIFLPDQSGDIKLELNAEYRVKLFSVVHGALFVDAANIWLFNDNPLKPGGRFSKDFMDELAVGTGFGLRFDLSFLILRTDLAFPVRKPWFNKGDRWVIDQIDFADKYWRRENLIFNLAIGYPF